MPKKINNIVNILSFVCFLEKKNLFLFWSLGGGGFFFFFLIFFIFLFFGSSLKYDIFADFGTSLV